MLHSGLATPSRLRPAAPYLSLVTDCGLVGELDLGRLEDCVLLQNRRLTLVVSERLLAVEALVEDHPHAPHVHLTADLWWVLADYEALRWQVPVTVTYLLIVLTSKKRVHKYFILT